MVKKGDKKTNKAVELLYELSMSDNFIKDIKKIRKLLKIPNKGFKNLNDENRGYWGQPLFFGVENPLSRGFLFGSPGRDVSTLISLDSKFFRRKILV